MKAYLCDLQTTLWGLTASHPDCDSGRRRADIIA